MALSQCELGRINTAFIERLNATCRARLPALARRTRNLAQGCSRLRCEMFWSGAVYKLRHLSGMPPRSTMRAAAYRPREADNVREYRKRSAGAEDARSQLSPRLSLNFAP